ncbi:MAG: hypothetical protein ACR2PL_06990 [Dehalococcoidia bacterium]
MKRLEETFAIDAGAHQFYIQDDGDVGNFGEIWTQQVVNDRLGVLSRGVAIRALRADVVPVKVELYTNEPEEELSGWDHVAEASLEIITGHVAVVGCFDGLVGAPRIALTSGTYAVRIFSGGLDTLNGNGIDGDDHYRVVLWPDGYRPPRVLKRWVRPR